MKNSLTIVFNAYYSEKSLNKILRKLQKFKILIIENSLQGELKKKLENKYKNVKVLLPKKNLGLAEGYNLGIQQSTTRYVFLNNPDIEISPKSIIQLLNYAKKIKKFGIISPVYEKEKIYKNYGSKNIISTKKDLTLVNWIDNNFLIDKSQIKNNLFDKNFFLYFETIDFCLNLNRKNKKLFVAKKIKFKHFGAQSIDRKYSHIVKLTRAWHYNWSKFYFFRKNFNYIYALTKISPNFYQAIKNLLLNLLRLKPFECKLNIFEIYGIISAVLFFKSFYRAKK